MTETIITKKVSDYAFDKCDLPRLYDGTIIDANIYINIKDTNHKIIKYNVDNCSNIVNPTETNSTQNIPCDTITTSKIRHIINFTTYNGNIYYSFDSLLNNKQLKHENTDMLNSIIMNKFNIGNCDNFALCGAVLIKSDIWIVSQHNKRKHRYLYLSTVKYKIHDGELVLTGDVQPKGSINIYRKSKYVGLNKCDARNVDIKSIDLDLTSKRLYVLLATDRKGFVSYLDYFSSLETFGSHLNTITHTHKCKHIIKYSPRGISVVKNNNIIVLCNAWCKSKNTDKEGFIYYNIFH